MNEPERSEWLHWSRCKALFAVAEALRWPLRGDKRWQLQIGRRATSGRTSLFHREGRRLDVVTIEVAIQAECF